ncbi:non-ribosomal peptide synthase/polyketide synthase [Mycetohabitans rhizoxinica]|uniref:Non-ribosomal peptide synthase/polyketide synthase n=1 Tax=Mycetohabitans rhizoxinica TaxID=412963 RepID=A0ABZ2PWA4_9BURK
MSAYSMPVPLSTSQADCNATQQDCPLHLCVHQLFEAQVERTPQAVAVVLGAQSITYADLERRANQLAWHLRTLGVGPDVVVGLGVTRSIEMVVGILGILKAGGAYLPLDPSYPHERLTYMMQQARVPVLVTQSPLQQALPRMAASCVCLDTDWAQIAAEPDTRPSSGVLPAHLAYVTYTSGSTGQPKGVMTRHGGAANYLNFLVRHYRVSEKDVVLNVASLAFDASVRDLIGPLIAGARVVLIPTAHAKEPHRYVGALHEQRVTALLSITPSLLRSVCQVAEHRGVCDALRLILVSGEALDAQLVARVHQTLGAQVQVFNQYGPTECTMTSTWFAAVPDTPGLVPIGEPLSNVRVYVLDRQFKPLSPGVTGELYIAGAGLARGYFNQPALSAERFVANPFGHGERLYRTGDLGRWRVDGRLDYVGRIDDQIKLRGQRVEPGEIEACLAQHPQVRDAVVLARGDGEDTRLVAYVVAESDAPLASTLHAHVAARLPDYMVPAAFVRLNAFPLTPNGKLDRRALPAPDADALARQAYEVPQGELETTLAEIWAELLGVERVGRHDSFFALGGHSLLAVQLLNRIAGLGADVPLATLFASPTLAAFAAAVEAQGHHGTDMLLPIPPVPREGSLPLSFAQQRLWFLAQLDGVSRTYHMSRALRVRGPLNRAAWQQALDALFARHDALRSLFVSVEGQPQVQLLPAGTGVPMTWHDLRGVPDADAQLARLSDEAVHAPFDLAHGPLLRACGIQLADNEHVLVLTQHHIVSDGWSMEVSVRELNALYTAACRGQPDPLPPLAVQYPDYAAWQRQWLSGERLQAQSEYWRTTLADAPVLLALPTDRPRPAQQSFAGAQVSVRIDASTTQALKRLSQEQGTTLFMTVLAAWSAVLARLSGQDDLVIGVPSANRGHPAIEPLIGFFVNTLALRVDLSGEPTTTQLLERVRHTTLEAQAHQDLPFEQVVEIVQPLRRLNHTPLFQVMFAWQNTQPERWHLPDLAVTPTELEGNTVKFDLELELHESGDAIVGALGYASALFDRATIERHVGYLQTMLQAMAVDAAHPVTRVELLAPAERTLLLKTWNATECDYPSQLCIHQLFEAQVERTPKTTALVYEDQTLSYAQLNAQANRLAHRLIELGVKPDARVAICVERSPSMVVGLLAILKAGGAYVPLDPAYPGERLAHILADATPQIVLADAAGRAALGEAALADRTVLDPNTLPDRADTNPLVPDLTSHHLAYVIYTSGSTGMPKGVLIRHGGVINQITALPQQLELGVQDRRLQFASPAFDTSVEEIFSTLTVGAALVLRTDAWLVEARKFWALCQAHRISVVGLPAQFWAQLAQEDVPIADSVRSVMISGDAVSVSAWNAWFTGRGYRPHLLNSYGPTETTVSATIHEITHVEGDWRTIGRPIANTRLYLLDAHKQPVPLGAVGELYIGGAGVARGYLNRPELTAERFVRDPFTDEPDARMYKTGDVARYLPDGNLEFLGRNDHQVKIRGFRIEPGEIEACLTQHPQVHDAVVLVMGEGQTKRLVAYVVAESDEALAGTLRAHVAAALPEYMVPNAFVRLDVFPLTPNGKLDRRALPAPSAEAFAHQAYEAPQGELETDLAAIWAELLGVERISRHDSFFALGGHSLLGVRLLNRIAGLGADVPLATLFASPTLAAFAAAIDARRHHSTGTLPEIAPVSREGHLPLSFAQQRLWFLAQFDGVSRTYHMSLAWRVHGPLNRAAWQHALDALFARHEALRSVFVSVGGQPQVQLLPAETGVPMTWHDLRGVPDRQAQLAQLSEEAAQAPFDLAQGPLLRACGIQLSDDEHMLVLTQHHIVSDGWSIEVLVRELSALYTAACRGQPDPLPPLAVQYPDYAAWQRQWLSGERLQAQSEYWRMTLADAPVLLELPTDRPRPAQPSFAGAQVPVCIDADTTSALKRLSGEHGTTLFMTVLAAWSAVLARLSGQDDLVIGTPSANRGHPAIEPLIGFFVNTLALRVDLSGEPTTTQLLERVRRTTLEAQMHQDLPFEQVVEIVQPPRRLNHTPLFQVMFAWQGAQTEHWCLPDLTLTPTELGDNPIKFDLELGLHESGNEIVGALGYASALFDRATIERHVGYLQTVLQAMAADAAHPVTRVELLAPAERTLLLKTWNATQQPYPSHLCVHQLFEAQAERTPEATALVTQEQTLSYAELNARANRLAHQLIELGVKPDARVAICVERSPAMVVGLLAILKAGGAYVPLDPVYPGERLAHILTDAAPAIVLADAAGWTALGDTALASRTVLDPNELPELADTNPAVPGLTARDLAYVIYTSGSTGTPKGVMVPHCGVVNLAQAQIACFGVNARSRILQFASFSFDASSSEMVMAFGSGATLYLPPKAVRHDRRELWDYLARHAITHATLPPALLQHSEDLLSLSLPLTVILAGEAPSSTLIQALAKQGTVFNAYGPTEATVCATIWRGLRDFDGKVVPIGRPIANTRLYLLDAHKQPVPLGAVGELYIGGVGVARGYLNRPELTAERFMRDPFTDEPDARMYRTGDVARYLPDGNLEFLGRNDHQVKIRGFRIEPGEIEACLNSHPQVHDALVLTRGDGDEKRLVAYVRAEPDDALANTLRAYVAARLPDYMVPGAFVRLDVWPLTPNGKLDRRALPAPDSHALVHQVYEAPQGELETALAAIWAELLGVERVGRHDSFFALGGHSLLGVRLMNRVSALGADVPLATLFASPTLAAFAAAIDARRHHSTGTLPEIAPVSREGHLPLSFAQQRLWFLAQFDGVSRTYHMSLAWRVHGPLNRAAWQHALDALFARHEALRSVFVSVGGQPQVQLLPAETGVPMTWHDLRGVPDRQAQLAQLSEEAAQAPFDLAQGPLLRACGIQLSDDEHMLVLTQHHIVSDGWSIEVLVRELSALYTAACRGQPDPLPPLAVQYPDYAAWQRQWLSGERLQAQSEYWRMTLADAPVLLELPTDRPRPAQPSFAGAQVPVCIDADTTSALKRLSGEHGTTLFMTVLAAWSAVLARLSGQDDLVIGTPSANRGHPAIEPLIGFFVNTLALRVDLSGEPTTTQLLERVRRTTLEAQMHQDLPFEQVVEIVQPPRRLNHTPLFQVMFAWQGAQTEHWCLPDLTLTPTELGDNPIKFDLELGLHESGNEIVGALGYASALFDQTTIERHVGYLQTVLQAMAADATHPVTRIELLAPAERTLLLKTWNATQQPYPSHLCVHQLFEAQAERMPEATALVTQEQTLSYAELNARANRLAHQLIEWGVKPDARVAICVERSPAMVVGLLAVLKAGGTYVPLDPAYPPERLAHMMADSAPVVLLSVGTPPAAVTPCLGAGVPVLDLQADAAQWAHQSARNPTLALTAQSLAYIIYTSGSTGQPKGVMIPHRSAVNLVTSMVQKLGLTAHDRVLQCSSLSFDASVGEIFVTLTQGAALVLRTDAWLAGAAQFWALCKANRVSVTDLPTQFWAQLAQEKVSVPDSVRVVMISGEALSASAQSAWFAGAGHRPRLLNVYGPTETTVTATVHEVTNAENNWRTIGRPIDNTRLYILDAHKQPVPLGAMGELYIGGVGVARGYLNRPELTAERFVRDPFTDEPNARMYKTGDVARYLPDGNLEFLGRNDHQVKIRGFRIELGEIEACLAQHAQVHDAVVLAIGEGSAKRLVAYVVAEPDDALVSTLRAHVAANLPDYMVPAALVRLDAFPLTPNGKLDRRALPAPSTDAFAHQAYEAPQGELETTLAEIWSELLGVERVGRHDSFFTLGGHSLLAVRLINWVSARVAAVPLTTLFTAPTLAGFAAALSAQGHQGTDTLPEITPVPREGHLPLSFAQQRLWFLAQLDGVSDTYHIPLALRLRGTLNRVAWQHALDALWARHEALRSVFVSVDGQPQVQLLPAETGMPMTWHDLCGERDAQAQLVRLSTEAAQAPFDLARGPLIRACGMQLADDEHVMLLVQHHIVSDGWSIGVLVRELNALYRAACGESAEPLPALTTQYPDYAAWQRQWLSGERLQAQSDYWRTRLADAPVLLTLPTDRPRPAQQSFAGAYVPIRVDAQTTRALRRVSQAQGATLFMTVLAAWSAVLARLSGQDDLVIGTPSANRHHRQIEPLIGFFVNTLALRVDVSGEPSAAQLIERVRRTTLEAQAHQDLPFEQVVEIVQPPRRLEHTPLFQVMFAWQNNETEAWQLPSLEVTSAPLAYDVVKFDLELHLQEAEGEIAGSLGYATALFDRATIERHVGYVQTMLQAMAADEPHLVTRVELLTPAERTLLLETWNATQQEYPAHRCIHQLFEAQVERTPEATALVYEDQALSYAELNARANRLAHQLTELGVQPDARVAICVQRSPAMVVGLLAILKAGGGYVPLDPTYAGERPAHIVQDAAPEIVLADAAGRAALGDAALADRTVLDPNRLPEQPETNPSVPVLTPRHLAYVIYTSGSTGMPKGVMVEHAQVVRLFEATQPWYHFDENDIWCLFHSFAFDFSVWELWGALRHGGKLIIVPHQMARSPQDFHRLVCEQGVTVLNQTPSAFKAWIASQAQSPLRDQLRYVIFGGEALEPSILQAWYATRTEQGPQLVNMYGITETTVHVTYRPLRPEDSTQGGSPIGVRIPDLKLYLLDAYQQPVPLGAVGELYIGGAGVARGYLNRPELTAERFVRDPFSAEPDARMYKTGDLARYLPDGNLEFLGRNDHQVKIRGFRIELGEIEACLAQHAQVHDSVVLAMGKGQAKRLVAYVVAEPDDALAGNLRTHVSAALPEYMVPSAFVRLDALPLTPNGKLDRRALPAPDGQAFAHQAYEAPQGEVEAALAEIWAELLGVERISRHDSFFALGGHSLLAVQLIERLRRRGLRLSVRALFDTPVLSALAQSLSQHREVAVPPNRITPETSALTPDLLPLIELTQAEIDRIVEQVPGGVANIQDIYALSPLQDGILFHHLLATEGDPYLAIAQLAFDTRARLEQYLDAVQQVVNRHDILRTAFVWEGLSKPAQVVWRHAPLSVTEITLEAKDGPIAEQLVQRFDPRHTRLDLRQAPLLRCAIAQDTDGRWLMVQLQHHLIDDVSSLKIMHAEVRAFIEGKGETLPAPQPFRNLIAQARLGVSQAAHERFFTEQLADIEEPTLPFGLSQVHCDGAQVREVHRMLPQALNDRLRAHAKRLSVSLASLCHLTWAQVLARASGQRRVVFGTVLFGRMQAGSSADSAMGLFINTLPLRVDLAGSVESAVRATHARLAALLEHEHASLALAQRCSRVPAGTPLFSALLNYRHNALSTDEHSMLPGVEWLSAEERTNYPLMLSVEDFGHALGLTAQVVASLDPDRVCGYMQQALHSLAEALETMPEWPIGQLEILPNEERERLLQTWNATQQPYPSHLCVHQLFEAQVERTPEATALVSEDQAVSYAELNTRANRLAHQLIELGVKPDARVAICIERSPAMVVGLLAILKAGGAYVPLDPAYPGERLAHILTDAAPAIVLADAAGRTALGDAVLASRTVFDPHSVPQRADTNPVVDGLMSHHLAYVIYTSGSTGKPKGVMVEHRNVVNFLTAMSSSPGITSDDRLLAVTSIAFDIAGLELYLPMSQGATVVMASRDEVTDPVKLHNRIIEQRITVMQAVPSVWRALLELPEPMLNLKVLCGGEALPSSLSIRLGRATGGLWNLYGPTETTIWSSALQWVGPRDTDGPTVPIGRPIANTQLYVLDAYGQPVPLGAVGELYIGGAGVTRGYLNRPELTTERFVRNPFSQEADARMYKTGDWARYLPNGNLEFLGRNDHQVKIRGFRIELGEIEACLAAHPQVRDAVVLARGEGVNQRLIAYVVAEKDETLTSVLHAHLAANLPDYMVPAALVRLDAFPLTPNGKLDRRALPASDEDALVRQVYEAPQGQFETALAAIWTELLGVECVGRHDSFFALGGHSLLAMHLMSRVRDVLGVELAIRNLFEAPTLRGLAQRLVEQQGSQESSFGVLLALKPQGSRPPLFCIHPAMGLSWSYMGLLPHLDSDQPLYGLQARGFDGTRPLASKIETMASDYLEQIRRIQPQGPYYLLGWSLGGMVAHSMAVQLEQQGESVALLALLDSHPSPGVLDDVPEFDEAAHYAALVTQYGEGLISAMDEPLRWNAWEIAKNHHRILKDFSPPIYGGNALFFHTTLVDDASPTLVPRDAWQPYVRGNIEIYDIHCVHRALLEPEPAAAIGRVIARKLNELADQRRESAYPVAQA